MSAARPGGRRLRHPSLIAGSVLLALVLGPALLSVVWTPDPPGRIDILHRLEPPSRQHPLGTDPFGRDLLSILMVGARHSAIVAAEAVALGAAFGVPSGLLAASEARGAALIRALSDLALGFPPLLTTAMLAAASGPGVLSAVLAIAIFSMPGFIRITEAEARAILARDFIAASRVAGRGAISIHLRHVIPNLASTLIVQLTVWTALAILAEAGLSYLGLGVPPPAPSLGRALADYQERIFDDPLLVIAPGAAIALFVLGLNQLGDGLRDALDPRAGQA